MRENEGLVGVRMPLQKLPGDWSRNWGLGSFGAKGSGFGGWGWRLTSHFKVLG